MIPPRITEEDIRAAARKHGSFDDYGEDAVCYSFDQDELDAFARAILALAACAMTPARKKRRVSVCAWLHLHADPEVRRGLRIIGPAVIARSPGPCFYRTGEECLGWIQVKGGRFLPGLYACREVRRGR